MNSALSASVISVFILSSMLVFIGVTNNIKPVQITGAFLENENPEISVAGVSTDKAVYHSAELLKLDVVVDSNMPLENAKVTASGINGRMNLEKTINLTEGENPVSFEYTLPKCNVCGGIAAGKYEISCGVSYGNLTSGNSTLVEILQ